MTFVSKPDDASEIRQGIYTTIGSARDLVGPIETPTYGVSGTGRGQESGIYTEENSEGSETVTQRSIDVNVLISKCIF